MSRPEPKELPAVGTVMVDTARDRVGEFQAEVSGRLHLRPIGGGREWAASPDYVREATKDERVRARMKSGDAASRQGRES